jgi:hypothetical protein
MGEPAGGPSPLFILGILARSGTNYLHDLLALHPDCETRRPHEDYLVAHLDILASYVTTVESRWTAEGAAPAGTLRRAMGRGLASFVTEGSRKRYVLMKTPTVDNMGHFFNILPDAPLLVIVRDGRAVVESGVRSFGQKGWSYEKATRWWATAANQLLAFRRSPGLSERPFRLLHYEKLYSDNETQMRQLLAFLGLDPGRYDFAQAQALAVRGSSSYHAQESGRPQWRPVEKDEGFQPLERWRGWDRRRHERFNWLAGQPMTELGYSLERFAGQSAYWRLWNRWLDFRWSARRQARLLRQESARSWRRWRQVSRSPW